MNYIQELNSFEQWLESNHLSANAQLLWYKLMQRFNKANWKEWIQVDNLRLMAAMQAGSEKTFIRCRDELVENELLEYQKGKKGCPNKYRLIPFTAENTVNNTVESEIYQEVKKTAEVTDIDKRNINKKKDTKVSKEKVSYSDSPELNAAIHDYLAYRKNIKAPMTEHAIDLLLSKLDKMAADDCKKKIAILNQSILNGWKGVFELREDRQDNKKTAANCKKNTFSNFQQRDTDYDSLINNYYGLNMA